MRLIRQIHPYTCHLCDATMHTFVRGERGYVFDVPLCDGCRDHEIAKAEEARQKDEATR
jgi:hypothetical protein